ncbi:MAG: DNA repair exonuclease [Nitrospira sp.]|jgi:exonuclease SbcD|uniref:metallophosphoesterase family protein n=1 Tax=Nitrospira sp. ND1 TaxID=1658518 RepID=UPI0009BB5F67|nr:DNA repair exonuclease [Nitrospira sp. ND1]MBK7420115.1 DNA repair exonuclease [Nitrospira sp.]MBP6200212.1 DNA repair exonuclease [Nitrospira sp.]MBP8198988.1 DNA repair exonuclease [Nitrospira sp.]SLM41855.1 putative Metallophosphoesterase, DNA repair exonuclease SbcCD, subunit D [Nitrospira sp. ND1]HAN92563.1 DNA repair exonuclease [Nitrospira sp.]
MRFIHASDLHIDSPLRGLDRYDGAPVDRLRSATRSALERLVDRALTERVDFLLLAGDIYDRDWQDFHTGLFFRGQMVRLERAGIRCFIVQGNHDAQGVISRQLTLPSNVTVFSSRAAQTIRLDDLSVAIHGRSFPEREVNEDLVPSYPPPVPGFFNIGLLHTSLTGRAGHDTYAPTDLPTLVAKGYDYWALGHVHAREVLNERPRIVFCGNLQGRHAKETGAKGCELVTVEAGRVEAEFIALDVVRWSQLSVPLDGVDRLESLNEAFARALEPVLAGTTDRLHAVRVTLTGSTELHRLEAAQPGTLAAAMHAAAQDIGTAEIWIEQVRLDLSTPLDRARAAQRQDAVGELVRLVDTIAGDDTELMRRAQVELGDLLGAMPAEVTAGDVPRLDDPAELRSLLMDAEATVLARLSASGEEA